MESTNRQNGNITKLNIKLPSDPAIPLLDIPKKKENICPDKILCASIYSSIIMTAKKWKQSK